MTSTIVFEVDLTIHRDEKLGPLTNSVTTGILHPDQFEPSPDLGRLDTEQRREDVSTWLPSLLNGSNVNLKHGDRLTLSGKQALYVRNMYGIGFAPEDRAWLKIISVS